jgi:hypothetical protein
VALHLRKVDPAKCHAGRPSPCNTHSTRNAHALAGYLAEYRTTSTLPRKTSFRALQYGSGECSNWGRPTSRHGRVAPLLSTNGIVDEFVVRGLLSLHDASGTETRRVRQMWHIVHPSLAGLTRHGLGQCSDSAVGTSRLGCLGFAGLEASGHTVSRMAVVVGYAVTPQDLLTAYVCPRPRSVGQKHIKQSHKVFTCSHTAYAQPGRSPKRPQPSVVRACACLRLSALLRLDFRLQWTASAQAPGLKSLPSSLLAPPLNVLN